MIRKAVRDDIPGVVRIYDAITTLEAEGKIHIGWVKDVYPVEEDALEALEAGELFVAEENGEIAGYAYADRAFERRAYCWDADMSVYISKKWHGKGIGRRFYALLEDALRRMDYVSAYALVTEENAASCAFHEKMGYEKMCVMPRTGYKMGRWLGVTWYVKFLREADDPGDAPKSWRDVR